MDNFKLYFLSRGQPLSLKNLLIFVQIISMLWDLFGNLIFAVIARMSCGNRILNRNASSSTWNK